MKTGDSGRKGKKKGERVRKNGYERKEGARLSGERRRKKGKSEGKLVFLNEMDGKRKK